MNNIKLLSTFAVFFTLLFSCKKADNNVDTFIKTFGDDGSENVASAIETRDGNILLAVNYQPADESIHHQIKLLKINKNGLLIWEKTYKNLERIYVKKVVENVNGEILIAGRRDLGNFINEPWFILTDNEGDELKSFTIDILTPGRVEDVIVVPEGYFIACSKDILRNQPKPRAIIMLLDFAGNTSWSKIIFTDTLNLSYNKIQALKLLQDGSVMAVGVADNSLLYNTNTEFGFFQTNNSLLINVDYNKTQWLKFMKIYDEEFEHNPLKMLLLNNNVLISGWTYAPGNGFNSYYFRILNTKGDSVNHKIFENWESTLNVKLANANNGYFYALVNSVWYISPDDNFFVKKYDYNGNEITSFKYSLKRSLGAAVLPQKDGSLIIIANTGLMGESKNKGDVLVIKVDENGNL